MAVRLTQVPLRELDVTLTRKKKKKAKMMKFNKANNITTLMQTDNDIHEIEKNM